MSREPQRRQHIVCLSFDFDALSLPIARGHTTPTKLSQGEFGVVGARRIASLLDKHRVPSTWFIPGHTIETFPGLCAQIASKHEASGSGTVG